MQVRLRQDATPAQPPLCFPPLPCEQVAMLALCDLVKAANVYLSKRQDAAGTRRPL